MFSVHVAFHPLYDICFLQFHPALLYLDLLLTPCNAALVVKFRTFKFTKHCIVKSFGNNYISDPLSSLNGKSFFSLLSFLLKFRE